MGQFEDFNKKDIEIIIDILKGIKENRDINKIDEAILLLYRAKEDLDYDLK